MANSVDPDPMLCSVVSDLGIRWLLRLSVSILWVKVPRKPASENVVCLCRMLHLLANFSNILFAYRQTVCRSALFATRQ